LAFSSCSLGSSSGAGTSGIRLWWLKPGSDLWKEALITNIGRPCWMAVTRRVEKLPPSRTRSTL
jgi:hypothetical protein